MRATRPAAFTVASNRLWSALTGVRGELR